MLAQGLSAQASRPLSEASSEQETQRTQKGKTGSELVEELPALSPAAEKAMQTIQRKDLESILRFLASDELEGRDTPSKGLEIAGDYVAKEFRARGLSGLGKKGSFFQYAEVPTHKLPRHGVRVTMKDGDKLPYLAVIGASSQDTELAAMPGADSVIRFLDSTKLAAASGRMRRLGTYGSLRIAARRARRAGAKALLIRCKKDGTLVAIAKRLRDYGSLGRRRPGLDIPALLVPMDFPKGIDVRLLIPGVTMGKVECRNVVGVLRGSDKEAAKEAILLSAHLDHIGMAPSGKDRIFNGADDDATGVSAVLALARAFGSLKERPKRSIVFACFYGEEKGLIGSAYMAKHPLWPNERLVANLNFEMLGRPESEKGLRGNAWVTGWRNSTLGPILAAGAKRSGVRIFEHPRYSRMLYGASDNYSFVRVGVIAHSISAGGLHRDYHKVTDEVKKLDFEHMEIVIRGLFAASLPLAQGLRTPKKLDPRRRKR